jgi:hypothetical protein
VKDIPKDIDPVEFFSFLSKVTEYPTNGYQLSRAAQERGYSEGLVAFFEGMPGIFENEGDILPLAEEKSKPPLGSALAIEEPPDTYQLTLSDITKGTPKD